MPTPVKLLLPPLSDAKSGLNQKPILLFALSGTVMTLLKYQNLLLRASKIREPDRKTIGGKGFWFKEPGAYAIAMQFDYFLLLRIL